MPVDGFTEVMAEDNHAVSSLGLGLMQGDIDIAQQLADGLAILWVTDHPQACTDFQYISPQVEFLFHCSEQFVPQFGGLLNVPLLQEDAEHITTESRNRCICG